uniref:Putative small t antigen n=1 Tax=Gammapolyomavirus anseris TaxID=1891746 RepID=A0A6B9PDW4_9POLY|nr:putative small t antigen [Gammapolyomavirus anseris]
MSFREIAELREMLSLPPHASYEDIKAAYRRAALMFHPDKGGDEEKMKRLNYLMERAREYKPEEDLYCDEELSSSEEEDVPRPSTNATAEDSGYASFTSRVSELEFLHARAKLENLKSSLGRFFCKVDAGRKQCLMPEYLALKRAFCEMPWNLFDIDPDKL